MQKKFYRWAKKFLGGVGNQAAIFIELPNPPILDNADMTKRASRRKKATNSMVRNVAFYFLKIANGKIEVFSH